MEPFEREALKPKPCLAISSWSPLEDSLNRKPPDGSLGSRV